jgi:hypothetical protein
MSRNQLPKLLATVRGRYIFRIKGIVPLGLRIYV